MTSGVSAVILAGGRSDRFGRDKLAEPIDGRPLLQHAIDAVRPMASEIIVVVPPGADPPLPPDVTVVHDAVAFGGPLAGLLAGLGAAHEPVVVVVGGDMPTLDVRVLGSMVSALGGGRGGAVVLEHEGRARPLPMVIRREPGLTGAERLIAGGERRLRALVDALSASVLPETEWRAIDPDGRTIRDIDTEADLG